MPRASLRERFFPLHHSDEVDRLLGAFEWCVVFKAGTSDKTFDAWDVAQKALEPRPDVAVGFIRLTPGRSVSMRVREASDSPAAAAISWPAARSAAARTAPTRPAPTTPMEGIFWSPSFRSSPARGTGLLGGHT